MLLNSNDIEKIIPHRYPFLLVDKVIEMVPGQTCTAIKNVTANENFFQGHFPGQHVMPGVLIIEALAQTGAISILSMEEFKGKTAFFAGIDECKFRRKVIPGDTLRLVVEITKMRSSIGMGQARAYVGDELAVECIVKFAIG